MIALLVLGCNASRVRQIEAETQRLEHATVTQRDALHRLRRTFEKSQAYWAHRTPTQVPVDFDANQPLAAGGTTPDLLLVSIDTLRADHLGSYGYGRATSPFLDALAAEGTRFEQFWAPAPWTLPSHATMLSGLLPIHHGTFEDTTPLAAEVPLLQQSLQQAGYATAGVVSTLFVSRKFGFDRGFDYFDDFNITDPAANNRGTVDAVEVFSRGYHWAQKQPAGKPIFLFLHSYDVHYSYNAPPPHDTQFDRPAHLGDAHYKNYRYYQKHPLSSAQMQHQIAQYDEEIRYVDSELEQLIRRWRASGRELVVAITSDHGEEFGERGSWGHAHTLYPEQLHVPLIINGPGIQTQTVTERGGSEDLAPTLAALVGAHHPNGDGHNRSSQLRQGGKAGVSGRFAETSRFETNRLRVHDRGVDLMIDLRNGHEELYDLTVDEHARTDRRSERNQRAKELRALLSEHLGAPWKSQSAGRATPSGSAGVWYNDQVWHGPIPAGGRFQVVPLDGGFRWTTPTAEQGPWSARLGPHPAVNAPVVYDGPTWSGSEVQLSADETRMLKELGYIQD